MEITFLKVPSTKNNVIKRPDAGHFDNFLRCETLSDLYYKYFEAFTALNDEQKKMAFALRHQVYCVERNFEPPSSDHPGLEMDEYDDHAEQILLVRRGSDTVAGTVRLILPTVENPERCLPIQSVCDDPFIRDPALFPVQLTGEISRFCISKQFRRRLHDRKYAEDVPDYSDGIPADDAKRLIPHLTLGLIEQLVDRSLYHGLRFWCAEMEPTLLRLLAKLGIHFDEIGVPVVYHGLRQPCRLALGAMLERVFVERKDVWEVISRHGKHNDALAHMV